MANVKFSELTSIVSGDIAKKDTTQLIDTSAGKAKKVAFSELDNRWFQSRDPFLAGEWHLVGTDHCDMPGNPSAGEICGPLNARVTQSGGTVLTAAANLTYDGGRYGFLKLRSPASAGYAQYGSSNYSIVSSGQALLLRGTFRLDTKIPDGTDDSTFFFGFYDGSNALGNDNAVFLLDRSVSTTNWAVRTSQGGTDYDTVTGVALALNSWVLFEILLDVDNSNIKFYLNGSLVKETTSASEIPDDYIGWAANKTWVAGALNEIYIDTIELWRKVNSTIDTAGVSVEGPGV